MKLNWRKEMEKICEEIEKLEPTYSEISEYSEDADPYGELTFCRRDDNPLVIRFHDTWRKKNSRKMLTSKYYGISNLDY